LAIRGSAGEYLGERRMFAQRRQIFVCAGELSYTRR
jgi:hypothetical protein